MAEFERVAVLGFGTMGAGIAQVTAHSGRDVTVLETDQTRIDEGFGATSAFLDGGVSRGKITAEDKTRVLSRISATTDVGDLAGADLIIEAVSEQRDIKRALLGRVADVVSRRTVITTNTSALAVSDLATSVNAQERFAGLHFFNPAPLMKLVEVVAGLTTDPGVLARLMTFVEEIGKSPVTVKDRPGFLVNRLLMPYLNDAVQAYDDELATAEDIDTAIRLGLGYKRGPLELLDMIGLDVHLHATRSAYDATLDPVFAPPPLLRAMVAAERLGAKNGHGFKTQEVPA